MRSNSSVIIDLNDEEEPFITITHGCHFFVQKKETLGNQIVLTGYYYLEPNERREIIITVIDENTISIDLVGEDNDYWMSFPTGDTNKYHYRVPVDAPYEPYNIGDEDL